MTPWEWKIVIDLNRTHTGLKIIVKEPGSDKNCGETWYMEDTDRPLWAVSL